MTDMRRLIDLVEGSLRLPAWSGETITVLHNPTRPAFENFVDRHRTLRGLLSYDGNRLWVWPAHAAVHPNMIQELGVTGVNCIYFENGRWRGPDLDDEQMPEKYQPAIERLTPKEPPKITKHDIGLLNRLYDDLTEAVGTPAFKRWFKDSQVVDANGDPLIVYHGTNQTFDKFSKRRGGMATGPQAGTKHGFFFTNNHAEAMDYAKHAGTKVVANISSFEKESSRLQKEAERLERVAQRSNSNDDWNAYYRAHEAWESYEIDATREDANTNLNVISAYLSIQNPLMATFNGKMYSDHGDIENVVATARRNGNDGVIMRQIDDGPYGGHLSDHYVVFSPKQIKRV